MSKYTSCPWRKADIAEVSTLWHSGLRVFGMRTTTSSRVQYGVGTSMIGIYVSGKSGRPSSKY